MCGRWRRIPFRPGSRFHAGGIGDSYLAVRHSLSGAGPMAALEGYVSLPTGARAVSAGTWGAGIVVPINLPSIAGMAVSLTPEIDAVPNASGHSRHLAYGSVLGVSGELVRNLGGSLEIAGDQDDAPEGGSFNVEGRRQPGVSGRPTTCNSTSRSMSRLVAQVATDAEHGRLCPVALTLRL